MDMTKDMFLESDVFEQARSNFNVALQKLIKQMLDGGVSEGSINLKVDIQLYSEYIPNLDPAVEGETRCIRKPKLDHKVTTQITVKNETKGTYTSQMELVYDDELQKYVLVPVANTAQRSIFDKDFQENMQTDGDPDGQMVIEGEEYKALPMKDDTEESA